MAWRRKTRSCDAAREPDSPAAFSFLARVKSRRLVRLWKNPNALRGAEGHRAINIFRSNKAAARADRERARSAKMAADFCRPRRFLRRLFGAGARAMASNFARLNGRPEARPIAICAPAPRLLVAVLMTSIVPRAARNAAPVALRAALETHRPAARCWRWQRRWRTAPAHFARAC